MNQRIKYCLILYFCLEECVSALVFWHTCIQYLNHSFKEIIFFLRMYQRDNETEHGHYETQERKIKFCFYITPHLFIKLSI